MQNTAEEKVKSFLEVYDRPVLWQALRSICDRPHHELRIEKPFVDVGEAHSLDASLLGESAMAPGAVSTTDRMAHFTSGGRKWRFLKVYDRRIVREYRTEANLFVAHFVRDSIKKVRLLATLIAKDPILCEYQGDLRGVTGRLHEIWSELPQGLKSTPLGTIPLDNPLLQFDPCYHVVLECWIQAGA